MDQKIFRTEEPMKANKKNRDQSIPNDNVKQKINCMAGFQTI